MNRSEQICAALRSAILERALLPGMKLPEDSLGERFGSSRTIVRQALERLAAEGLVELRRNRGAVVATPSLEEARDLFDLRCQIEDLVVSRLSAEFSQKHLDALNAHLDKEIAAEKGPEPVSIRLATEFHILMAQLGQSVVFAVVVGAPWPGHCARCRAIIHRAFTGAHASSFLSDRARPLALCT